MIKKQSAEDIAKILTENSDDKNIISELFDYLEFNGRIRCFVDAVKLDSLIRSFCETKNNNTLIEIIRLIQQGKALADMDDLEFFGNIKNYLLEHLTENLTLEQIANTFHISYYYLSHLFKKNQGQSLNQFRNNKRLEKAVHELLETHEKISEIALNCGFDSVSYFTEMFVKNIGETPTDFRNRCAGHTMHEFFDLNDMLLAAKMPSIHILDNPKVYEHPQPDKYIRVHDPGEEYGYFLHEAAIIEFNGVLYASWYNCKEKELVGYTPIVGRRSYDGGKTWSDAEIIADDKSGNILYCPPVYGICDGKLYLLLNQMVSADHIHSLDLYVLNPKTDAFEFIWSRPIPFKLNTNVVSLPNGKLMIPGRVAKLDGFPRTPAVLISDSGKIDAEWRIVKVAENGTLPDGETLVHPETTVICCDNKLYLFCRNDHRRVPLVYISEDFGEHWSLPIGHDIPYINSKIYCGQLSSNRFYLIANTENSDRSKLVLFVSEKNEVRFTKEIVLMDCKKTDGIKMCHYPCAVENNGKLYIIATASYEGEIRNDRGAILIQVDL